MSCLNLSACPECGNLLGFPSDIDSVFPVASNRWLEYRRIFRAISAEIKRCYGQESRENSVEVRRKIWQKSTNERKAAKPLLARVSSRSRRRERH
jgi:flagellar biosynthesis chaperone FliJ